MKNFFTTFCLAINVLFTPNVFAQERNIIYVYQDEGVNEESLMQTVSTFKTLMNKYAVQTISSQQLKDGVWTKDAVLFVMPGGADVPYGKKLNGKGNNIIKRYVKNGGAFLGICAGSYYGSSYVEFDKGGSLEVLANRELSFFKGKAIGPILAPYDYKIKSGSRAAAIHAIFTNVPETRVFYNGGGFFANAEQYANTKVIGTYANNLPAIIFVNYGTGKVLLSGVHFEWDPYLLDTRDHYVHQIIGPLKKANVSRKALFNALMQLLGLG